MTIQTDLADLLASVEAARAALHPHLEPGLLRRIVEIEHDADTDGESARKAIQKLIEAAVRAQSPTEEG